MISPANRLKPVFGVAAILFILIAILTALTENYILIAIPFVLLLCYTAWQEKTTLFWLLLLSLPFSIEYHFSSSLGTDLPAEFLMIFVSFLFLAAWFYNPSLLPAKIFSHPLLLILLAMLLWTLVTVCFSTNPVVSGKFLLAKTWYIGAFLLAPLVVFREKKNIHTAFIILIAAMILVILIIFVRHSASGFSFATINNAAAPFFRNHVNYSAMLVCILPVMFAFFNFAKSKMKVLIVVCMLLILMAIFFSYARGAWLALIAGVLAGWLIKKKLLLSAYIAAFVIIAGALFWLRNNDRYLEYAHDYRTTIFHKDFGEHLVATYQLKDVSTAERFYRWIAGVRMIKDNWLTGFGPNTFYPNYKGYTVPAYKTWVSDNPDHSTVHNYFLLTAIEQGIPGLLLLLLLLGCLLWYAQSLYHRIKDPLYKTIALYSGVVLCMIITLNFLSDLIETDKIGSLFFLCIAMLIVADKEENNKKQEPKKIQ